METKIIRFAAFVVGLHLSSLPAEAAGQARALYRNESSQQTTIQNQNPGVLSFSGYIKASQAQTGGAAVLDECGFGQPFSQWFPSENYGEAIREQVITALHPLPTDMRNVIIGGGKPLRYKFLLYDGTGTDVTAFNPDDIATWYISADRTAIIAQIAVLKEAVAASPLDLGLRDLLLDVYYDLAVAEMQAAKPQLATLAKFRLGITPPPSGRFAIDKEIDTYLMIETAFSNAINQYADLLSVPFPNIDPSSFDAAAAEGTPMGQYIFRREQKRRSTMSAQYVGSGGGGIKDVPDVDDSSNQAVARTPGVALFNGYKDLNALLDLVGQRQRHLAALCTLRGSRGADGDVARARESIATATGASATDLQLIQSWFPELFPPDLAALTPSELTAVKVLQQQSGILGAFTTLQNGRIDLLAVLPYLNGSANSLGYDPDFLLLVQGSAGPGGVPLDTYDTLRNMLKGNNKPLTVALNKLNSTPGVSPPDGAKALYDSFQEKTDRVAADIDFEDDMLDDRYFAITGFRITDNPNFNPQFPNPKPGSELAQVIATIAALTDRQTTRKLLSENFDDLLAEDIDATKAGYARQLVGLAQGKEQVLKNAVSKYRNTTTPLYDANTVAKTLAAASQAAMDATSAAAGATNPVAGGTTLAVGAGNLVVQTATTAIIANNEKNIDFAGIQFSADLEGSDAAIAVNQARLDLAALNREQLSNTLDTNSDVAAMTQASSQKTQLMSELARIVAVREENVAKIRKKSFASPLHYHRAEAALLQADDSFRAAQRWMFYTLQALNYKWHGNFAVDAGGKRYDTSTLFKCRNAQELDDLLTQMEEWNAVRETQTSSSPLLFSRISIRDHILARNPNRFDPVNPGDPGLRVDDTVTPPPPTLTAVPTSLYFQRLLKAKYSEANGDIVIPFSTAFGNQIVDRIDGNFFRGASYNAAGTITDKGFWREKLHYVKVNIVASNAPAVTASYSANLVYGGTTYFHTRIPPRGDRSISGLAIDDARGELLVAPFRRWVSPDFDNNFIAETEHLASIPIGYSQGSAVIQGPGGVQDNLGTNFQVNDFFGRSIAASGWRLVIPRINNGGFLINPDNITDIELLIAYKHSSRE